MDKTISISVEKSGNDNMAKTMMEKTVMVLKKLGVSEETLKQVVKEATPKLQELDKNNNSIQNNNDTSSMIDNAQNEDNLSLQDILNKC